MTSVAASRPSFRPDKSDVIIVLGAKIRPGGLASPALRRRMLHAIDLFQRGLSDVLIVSGGMGEHPPSEAEMMRRIAVEHGVPQEKIVMEDTAETTLDSALACSRMIRRSSWSTALLVTDRFHMTRSAVLFRLCGVNIRCSPAKDRTFGPKRWKWWYWHLRELIALPWSLGCLFIRRVKRH